MRARGLRAQGDLQWERIAQGATITPTERFAVFNGECVRTPVRGRMDLVAEPRLGPMVIEEYDSAIVVPPGWSVRRADKNFVLNVKFPGATFMRGLTIYRINSVVFGALAEATPDRAIAADEGGTNIVVMEGYDDAYERGNLQIRADRVKIPPYGLYGGAPGGKSRSVLDPSHPPLYTQ